MEPTLGFDLLGWSWELSLSLSHALLALPTKARILCLDFIIEYNSLREEG